MKTGITICRRERITRHDDQPYLDRLETLCVRRFHFLCPSAHAVLMPWKPAPHRAIRLKARDVRPHASARGYTYRWQQARKAFLREHPLCAACLAMTPRRLTPATVVDHIVPHQGDEARFWQRSNWQALCAACHNAKTVRQDGGFGRVVQP